MKSQLLGAILLGGALLCPAALAQQSVVTTPQASNSGNSSSTIASSTQFQQIWASQANPSSGGTSGHRNGCLVMNLSTDRQWVYFQGPGMATPTSGNTSTIKDLAVPLEPAPATNGAGGYVLCATSAGGALQDAVWILGTSGDKFYANRQ